MSKLNVQAVFDCLCDCVLHELSTKAIIREHDDQNKIMQLIRFIQDERKSRNLPPLDFSVKPEGLKLTWTVYNTGGGCMVWNYEYEGSKGNTHSIHVSDECMINTNVSTDEYWGMDQNDQECTHLGEYMWFIHYPKISFNLCPYTGQELADLIAEDIAIFLPLM